CRHCRSGFPGVHARRVLLTVVRRPFTVSRRMLKPHNAVSEFSSGLPSEGDIAMTEPATPRIVSREEWEREQADLLARENAHTRAGGAVAAAGRRLPMTRMEPVTVRGPDGAVPLRDVFEGRRMLLVYHFMWNRGAPHHKQCEGCTHSQVAM